MDTVVVVQQVDVETRIDRLFDHMRRQGYAPQAPSPEVEQTDRIIFENGKCFRCGGEDVKLYPFFKANPRSYRPWVVCAECGWEREV